MYQVIMLYTLNLHNGVCQLTIIQLEVGRNKLSRLLLQTLWTRNLEEEEIKMDWIIKEGFMEEMRNELFIG